MRRSHLVRATISSTHAQLAHAKSSSNLKHPSVKPGTLSALSSSSVAEEPSSPGDPASFGSGSFAEAREAGRLNARLGEIEESVANLSEALEKAEETADARASRLEAAVAGINERLDKLLASDGGGSAAMPQNGTLLAPPAKTPGMHHRSWFTDQMDAGLEEVVFHGVMERGYSRSRSTSPVRSAGGALLVGGDTMGGFAQSPAVDAMVWARDANGRAHLVSAGSS